MCKLILTRLTRAGAYDALKRSGFSYKKTFYHPKADVQARKDFQTKLQGYEACDTPIIYVDESGFTDIVKTTVFVKDLNEFVTMNTAPPFL